MLAMNGWVSLQQSGAACVFAGGTASVGRSVVGIASRHDLYLTTPRQGEQGRGRRHVPGLRPPNHVDPQPPVRILEPGFVRAHVSSLTLRSRSSTVTQAIS